MSGGGILEISEYLIGFGLETFDGVDVFLWIGDGRSLNAILVDVNEWMYYSKLQTGLHDV